MGSLVITVFTWVSPREREGGGHFHIWLIQGGLRYEMSHGRGLEQP